MPRLRAALPLILALAHGLPARAETAAVLTLQLTGVEDTRAELEKDVHDALADKLAVVPAERVRAAIVADPTLGRCESGPCLAKLGGALDARFIASGEIVSETASSYSGALRIADAVDGRVLDEQKVTCEVCSWTELRDHLRATARALGERAASVGKVPSRSPTPTVPPSLPAPTVPPPPSPPGRLYRILKWSGTAAALGLVAGGAVMLAYDGRCAIDIPDDVPAGAGCPRVYDTAVEGGIFLGAGGIVAGAAVTFFILDRKPRLVPALSPTTGGAVATLRYTF